MNAPIAPQPLLSPFVRAAGIAASLAIISVVVAVAGRASESAVQTAQSVLNPPVRYVVLQPVEITAHRAGDPMAAACAGTRATSI